MDRIAVKGIRAYAHVGHTEAERRLGHAIEIDVELHADLSKAGRTDRLEDAPDYAEVFRRAKAVAEKGEFVLLESLAEQVAGAVAGLGQERTVVRIRKFRPPFGGEADYAEVEIVRS